MCVCACARRFQEQVHAKERAPKGAQRCASVPKRATHIVADDKHERVGVERGLLERLHDAAECVVHFEQRVTEERVHAALVLEARVVRERDVRVAEGDVGKEGPPRARAAGRVEREEVAHVLHVVVVERRQVRRLLHHVRAARLVAVAAVAAAARSRRIVERNGRAVRRVHRAGVRAAVNGRAVLAQRRVRAAHVDAVRHADVAVVAAPGRVVAAAGPAVAAAVAQVPLPGKEEVRDKVRELNSCWRSGKRGWMDGWMDGGECDLRPPLHGLQGEPLRLLCDGAHVAAAGGLADEQAARPQSAVASPRLAMPGPIALTFPVALVL